MLGVALLGVVKGGITARTRMVLFATGSWSHILEQRLAVAVCWSGSQGSNGKQTTGKFLVNENVWAGARRTKLLDNETESWTQAKSERRRGTGVNQSVAE